MPLRFSRRLFLLQLLGLTLAGCQSTPSFEGVLTIGVINYDGSEEIINQYAKFNRYLGEKTKAYIQLEPVFNENKAIESLEARAWSLVFAPPGLAAIAIARYQYIPLFPLLGVSNLRSILVVRKDNPIQDLKQLQGQIVALGQPGSATGYYLPLYNLYGLTLAEVLFAPTPKTVLEFVTQGKATAGAVSIAEFNEAGQTNLRTLYTDPHYVPSGVVLIGPNIERNRQEYIRQVMSEFPSVLAEEIGYIPNGKVPDYRYMITVVERVKLIASQLQNKPARLF
ncbi:phosphate/phosphite/phosphonate ABC transporter substrate-binding protein [Komarekiella sp. 'clone 1']|uniref:Phosphate/phosphite/phosphonate ABC transporter substrate-binding protein n=1 Tax=Komarekiella delphini-convector SJRDD-AB1 TaxID=2593771 RepID=A0AA40SVC9_9NOST|nr:PhnD/SsuA/transferrin family substrate-binding protein [Komarekiella delphini-convector]MBD6615673.1 phosphate/phosphite/phosphonate ABC transporter substrate-binding protein [Komarekiella delphini-convector SJRDD-AB1]